MLEGRKAALLQAVVAEHIRTAEPVGSKLLARNYGLSVSPATVRNTLATLEEEGYLTHPHTSAGRVPTAKGYRYYVDHCIAEKQLAQRERTVIDERCAKKVSNSRHRVKELAKAIADVSHEAIVVGFTPDDVYYTGLSYLLAQPEFAEPDATIPLSQVFDRLDEAMRKLLDAVHDDLLVVMGDENPFGDDTSVIVVRYGQEAEQLFGILGPTRMDYAENIALAKYAKDIIERSNR